MNCTGEKISLTSWRVISVSNGAQNTSHTKVAASMNIGLIKCRYVLNSKRETGVVWLTKNVINQGLLSKEVHDPWREVALEAPSGWDVDLEPRVSEGTSHDTAASGMPGDVERVLLRSCIDVGSISSKPVRRIKDGCLINRSAVVVGQRCVERPVPVSESPV